MVLVHAVKALAGAPRREASAFAVVEAILPGGSKAGGASRADLRAARQALGVLVLLEPVEDGKARLPALCGQLREVASGGSRPFLLH
eukprot:CAMPEP_0115525158 /NCGR_PEP_ID=MMETSP0271-20121206/81587_1 /TAXON_ID=71861 /ORGANISM="Scrippsiella trochoidea, Strain CCMP3099" /LENGTH=86 /DNA_ID=CAMNT_0002956751 /DNA_START=175 /DNA_END=432 /DNA_ORIENTATION=-